MGGLLFSDASGAAFNGSARRSDYGRTVRDVTTEEERIRTNLDIITNSNWTEDCGSRPNIDPVSDCDRTGFRVSNRYSMKYDRIGTN
jgi:hypothetical protein